MAIQNISISIKKKINLFIYPSLRNLIGITVFFVSCPVILKTADPIAKIGSLSLKTERLLS